MSTDTIKKYLRIDEQARPTPPPEVIIIEAQPMEKLDQFNHIIEVAPLPIHIPQQLPQRTPPPRITITMPSAVPQHHLSQLLEAGRQLHPLCRNAFVEKVQIGYYAYERRTEWRTCALAAIYAALFGPASIQRPDFSYTQAVWRVSQRVGWGIGERQVVGPTGRRNNVADEMIKLVDENLWSRATVAEWLASEGM